MQIYASANPLHKVWIHGEKVPLAAMDFQITRDVPEHYVSGMFVRAPEITITAIVADYYESCPCLSLNDEIEIETPANGRIKLKIYQINEEPLKRMLSFKANGFVMPKTLAEETPPLVITKEEMMKKMGYKPNEEKAVIFTDHYFNNIIGRNVYIFRCPGCFERHREDVEGRFECPCGEVLWVHPEDVTGLFNTWKKISTQTNT